MKRTCISIIILSATTTVASAQRALMLQLGNGVTDYIPTSEIREMTFGDDLSQLIITTADTTVSFNRTEVKGMGYAEMPAAMTVSYANDRATIQNPYLLRGVSANMQGAHVCITNPDTTRELSFELTGSTTNGSLLYNGAYKTTIILNGVTITNPTGAAIDIECGKRIAMQLKKNTVNTLVDGVNGVQKAALYCKGHLEIDKDGTLNLTGNTKHALAAKEYIQLKKAEGTINILAAKGDGIHCQQYFLANGFAVNISKTEGDGIQAEVSGDEGYAEDYADGSVNIQGGTFSISTSAVDVSGIKADGDICINELKGTPAITIAMTGNGSKGMKADGKMSIAAGDINISTTGGRYTDGTTTTTTRAGGWGPGGGGWPGGGGGFPGGGGGGFPGGENESGSSAKAIKAKGDIEIAGGNISVTTTGNGAEGMESKSKITVSGGSHYLKCYDDAINCSGQIIFDGGITVAVSTGNDAIDSNYGRTGAVVIGNGTVLSYTTKGGAEMGLDCDNNSYIQITGKGIAISAGGNQGGSSSATISNAAQGYAMLTSSISYQTGRYYTIADASGRNLVTYSLEGALNSSCSLITATGMQKGGAYSIKYSMTAPSDATTAFHGLYLGSTASGTTSVTTFTAK